MLCVFMLTSWNIATDPDDLAYQLCDGDHAFVFEHGDDFPDDVIVTVRDREHVAD